MPNNRAALSVENFEIILNQFITNNYLPRVVVLYHGGEPFVNKNIDHFIKRCKEIGVSKVVLNSNGLLLTEQISEKIIDAGLDEIRISLDGQSPEENNAIRRGSDFNRISKQIKYLIELKKKKNSATPNVMVDNINILKKDVLESFMAKGQASVDEIPEFLPKTFENEADQIGFRTYPAMVWPGYKEFGNFDVVTFDKLNPDYCSNLFETMTIMSNGNVVACCYDLPGEISFGNVFEQDYLKIWNSKGFSTFRKNFRNKVYANLCKNCNVVQPRYLYRKES